MEPREYLYNYIIVLYCTVLYCTVLYCTVPALLVDSLLDDLLLEGNEVGGSIPVAREGVVHGEDGAVVRVEGTEGPAGGMY